MVLRVNIPSFRKVKEDDEMYTVFLVDVWLSGHHQVIEKRYSEFEELHKQLKKIMKTPEFPPKKVLKWNTKVLEQRRVGLDAFFQGVLEHEPTPSIVHTFLETDALDASMDFENEEEQKTTHQPVVTLDADVFLRNLKTNCLPNIIEEGVKMGLYSTPSPNFNT
ncbi:sorting nexin-24 [Aplysia californica]|uniref:Sorting nexin-24 n=1 Tax=Aplysia californica TaxID=6500 RepID=A0ABM0K9P1_APLCA|nr:sorting nexin-24 [Aplysia californica]